MLLQWSAPEYVPRSFLVSGVSGTNKAVKQTDTSFRLTKQVADGLVDMQEVSKGLFLVQSEMAFKKETELCEEYPERKVFQLFLYEWDLRMGLSSKTRRALPAFPYTVQLTVWNFFPMRQPFWF